MVREQELIQALKLANIKICDLSQNCRIMTQSKFVNRSGENRQNASVKSRPVSLDRSQQSIGSRQSIKNGSNSRSKISAKPHIGGVSKPPASVLLRKNYVSPPTRHNLDRKSSIDRSRSISRKSFGSSSNMRSKLPIPSKKPPIGNANQRKISSNNSNKINQNALQNRLRPSKDNLSIDLNNSRDDSFEYHRKDVDFQKVSNPKSSYKYIKPKNPIQLKKTVTNHAEFNDSSQARNIERRARLEKLRQEAREFNL